MKFKKFVMALFAAALLAAPTPALAANQTQIKLVNSSQAPVLIFITLGAFPAFYGTNPGYIQNVATMGSMFNPPQSISGSGLQGSFTLAKGAATVLSMPSGTAISGNFCFGGPPLNCPTTQNPNGQNLAEFTLNNNTPAYVHPPEAPTPQEAIDISCVNGVNCIMEFDLKASPGGNWQTAGKPNVTAFQNYAIGIKPNSPNINKVGVFSIGCDNCTSSVNPGCGDAWSGWNVNSQAVCNVQRVATQSGGIVQIQFDRFVAGTPLK